MHTEKKMSSYIPADSFIIVHPKMKMITSYSLSRELWNDEGLKALKIGMITVRIPHETHHHKNVSIHPYMLYHQGTPYKRRFETALRELQFEASKTSAASTGSGAAVFGQVHRYEICGHETCSHSSMYFFI